MLSFHVVPVAVVLFAAGAVVEAQDTRTVRQLPQRFYLHQLRRSCRSRGWHRVSGAAKESYSTNVWLDTYMAAPVSPAGWTGFRPGVTNYLPTASYYEYRTHS